jgi:hypothetical protein
MNVTYQTTPEDAIKFNMYIFDTSPTIRAQHRRVRIVTTLIPPVLLIILAIATGITFNPTVIIILVLSAVAAFMIYKPFAKYYQEKTVDKLMNNESSKQFFTEKTLTLHPEQIQTIPEMGENKMSWKAIKDIKIVPEYAYLFIDTLNAVVIPKRVFPSGDAFDVFMQETNRLWQDATKTST